MVLLASAPHGSHTFWVVMTLVDGAAVVVCGVLAYFARRTGREERAKRYTYGVWGFFAWASLCLARAAMTS